MTKRQGFIGTSNETIKASLCTILELTPEKLDALIDATDLRPVVKEGLKRRPTKEIDEILHKHLSPYLDLVQKKEADLFIEFYVGTHAMGPEDLQEGNLSRMQQYTHYIKHLLSLGHPDMSRFLKAYATVDRQDHDSNDDYEEHYNESHLQGSQRLFKEDVLSKKNIPYPTTLGFLSRTYEAVINKDYLPFGFNQKVATAFGEVEKRKKEDRIVVEDKTPQYYCVSLRIPCKESPFFKETAIDWTKDYFLRLWMERHKGSYTDEHGILEPDYQYLWDQAFRGDHKPYLHAVEEA